MKEFLKRSSLLILAIALIIGFFSFIVATNEKDPAFRYHKTTWNGQPAAGRLHRNGWYTFYNIYEYPSGRWQVIGQIASMPAAEAVHFH